MRHDRRGLTVLSLLIILIVVVLLIVILFRARSPVGDDASPADAVASIPSQVEESAKLTSISAPATSVHAGDTDTVTVRLTNRSDAPLVGVTIRFEVGEGGGHAIPETVRSDSAGRASSAWTYGTTPGPNSLRISADVPNTRVEPLLFTVEALAGVDG